MSVAEITPEFLASLTPEVRAAIAQQLGGADTVTVVAAPTLKAVPVEAAVAALTTGTTRPKPSGYFSDVDMAGVPDGSTYDPLPEEIDFEAEIIKVEATTTKAGDRMLKLRHKILLPAAFSGRLVFDNILPDNTSVFPRQRTKSLFRVTDMLHEAPGECWITCEDPETELLHEVVRFRVKNEEYNGKITPKVKDLYARSQDFDGVEG